jgi:predicted homoserine dehydrogenase-like protein
MNLSSLPAARTAMGKPIRIGLISAGKLTSEIEVVFLSVEKTLGRT